MPDVGKPNQGEREFETGTDEFFKGQSEAQSGLLFLNHKRLFDEMLQESLETSRQQRTLFNKMMADSQMLSNQLMQNAIGVTHKVSEQSAETANMVGKQAVRHSDVAADNQWNPVQTAVGDTLLTRSVSIDDASLKALGAMVAATVSEALSKE